MAKDDEEERVFRKVVEDNLSFEKIVQAALGVMMAYGVVSDLQV